MRSLESYEALLARLRSYAGAAGSSQLQWDALLAERDALLAERDALLAERDALLAKKHNPLGSQVQEGKKSSLEISNRLSVNLNGHFENLFFIHDASFIKYWALLISRSDDPLLHKKHNGSHCFALHARQCLFVLLEKPDTCTSLLIQKFSLITIGASEFGAIGSISCDRAWLHGYCEYPEIVEHFLAKNLYKDLYIYSDGLKNVVAPYPAEQRALEAPNLSINWKHRNISNYVYFGWNMDQAEFLPELVLPALSIVHGYRSIYDWLARRVDYRRYVRDLSIDTCTNGSLVVFMRYYGRDAYAFKSEESSFTAADILARQLHQRCHANAVFIVSDSRCSKQFESDFATCLKRVFDSVTICQPAETAQGPLPGEIITYFLNKTCPDAPIYSFDGGMGAIARIMGCNNVIYLEPTEELGETFEFEETIYMIKQQVRNYTKVCEHIKSLGLSS